MGRCGMAAYVMAIVLLVALFASSAKCRPEPLDDGTASGSNGGINAMALNSTAALPVNGSSGGYGDVKLEFCIPKSCVYPGRGNAPCYCCQALKPPTCYETPEQCSGNCV